MGEKIGVSLNDYSYAVHPGSNSQARTSYIFVQSDAVGGAAYLRSSAANLFFFPSLLVNYYITSDAAMLSILAGN